MTPSKKKKVNGAKKGKQFEREIATALGHIFPDAQRELEYQAGGNRGTDIEETDLFQFQCKRYAGYAPIGKINEIKLESEAHYPVLITKGNKLECMAVLPFAKFVTLLEMAYGHTPRLVNPYVKAQAPLQLVVPESFQLSAPSLLEEKVGGRVQIVDAELGQGIVPPMVDLKPMYLPPIEIKIPELKQVLSLSSFL